MRNKKSCTVLLVEDSPEDMHVCVSYLKQSKECDYTVLEAVDARSGIALCRKVHVDLVLLDYELPDLNGIEFLELLRNKEGRLELPVVMVTGRGSEGVAVDAMKAGAVDYLAKDDLSPESLFRVTQNALERLDTLNEAANRDWEHEEVRRELGESEACFRNLVDSVREYGIILLDHQGQVRSWNAGARRLFNFHDHEVIGQHLESILAASEGQGGGASMHLPSPEDDGRHAGEQWMVRKNRGPFLASWAIAPLRGDAAEAMGYSLVVRELTEAAPNAARPEAAQTNEVRLRARIDCELRKPLAELVAHLHRTGRALQQAQLATDSELAKEHRACVRIGESLTEAVGGLLKQHFFLLTDARGSRVQSDH